MSDETPPPLLHRKTGQTYTIGDRTYGVIESVPLELRDYFAGQMVALLWQEICRTFRETDDEDIPLIAEAVRDSYRFADAMLVEREK